MRSPSNLVVLISIFLLCLLVVVSLQRYLDEPITTSANAWLDAPLYPAPEPRHQAIEDLLIKAEALSRSSHPEAAFPLFQAALQRIDVDGTAVLKARALDGLGTISRHLGDVYLSLSLHLRARSTLRQLGLNSAEAQSLENIARAYTALGQDALATDHLELAFDRQLVPWRRAVILIELATHRDLEGDCNLAMGHLRRAFILLAPSDANADRERLLTKSVLLDRLAGAATHCGQYDVAERAFLSSLAIVETWGYPRDQAIGRVNLGVMRMAQERYKEAREEILKGFERLPSSSFDLDLAIFHFRLGQAQRGLGELEGAQRSLEMSLGLLDKVQKTTSTTILRSSFANRHHILREEHISLLLQRFRLTEKSHFGHQALLTAERGRANDLLHWLTTSTPSQDPKTEQEKKRRQFIERSLRTLEHDRLLAIDSAAGMQEIAAIEEKQRQLVFQIQASREATLAKEPASTAAPSSPLEVQQIQRLLDSDTQLLVYSLGPETSALWYIDAHSSKAFELPGHEILETLTHIVFDRMAESDQSATLDVVETAHQAMEELSAALLDPVADLLTAPRIAIVADGPLQLLPFAALSHPRDGRAVVQEHQVVYLPSIAALIALRQREQQRPSFPFPSVAVIADPLYIGPSNTSSSHRSATSTLPSPAPLSHSRAEAEAIRNWLPAPEAGQFFLGAEAQREVLLEQRLAPSSVIHLSVHGEHDTQRPEFSHLVFASWDSAQRPIDGRLYVHEINDLDLSCDLLVLSACNTARGTIFRGEGLVGMPYAALGSGAQRALVSLWFVDDEATAELMDTFYEALLAEQMTPAAALQKAQQHFIGHPNLAWRSPYYWASFVLYGDWRWPHRPR